MDAFQILVIILSVFLGIFLVLAIVVCVMAYKLIKSLREIADRGGALIDRAEKISQALAKDAGAAGLVKKLVKYIVKSRK
ncbi:hypothetical protein CSA80_00665 [Candidatus Saccharibacteria bacterium]|nr:MAG: hypothetical protein CSA80_00665 [Candidatus Saccharibacteria bacterium]